jgi:hypothetical protein
MWTSPWPCGLVCTSAPPSFSTNARRASLSAQQQQQAQADGTFSALTHPTHCLHQGGAQRRTAPAAVRHITSTHARQQPRTRQARHLLLLDERDLPRGGPPVGVPLQQVEGAGVGVVGRHDGQRQRPARLGPQGKDVFDVQLQEAGAARALHRQRHLQPGRVQGGSAKAGGLVRGSGSGTGLSPCSMVTWQPRQRLPIP